MIPNEIEHGLVRTKPVDTAAIVEAAVAKQTGWIGVDLDGTLAYHSEWKGVHHVGEPIPLMLQRVKDWLAAGTEVRIVTARVGPCKDVNDAIRAREAIEKWCIKHLGVELRVTAMKDYAMIALWDDRAVQVIPNTGERADEKTVAADVLQRLDAAEAAVRQITAGPDKVLRCAFCGEPYPDGTPDQKSEVLAAHIRVCRVHPVGIENRALMAREKLFNRALALVMSDHGMTSEAALAWLKNDDDPCWEHHVANTPKECGAPFDETLPPTSAPS